MPEWILTKHEPTLELFQQVADQCRAVSQLCKNMAEIHDAYAIMYSSIHTTGGKGPETIVNLVGDRSASFMEQIGDMLNGMDAADESDEWMEPIFREAQRLFPQPKA